MKRVVRSKIGSGATLAPQLVLAKIIHLNDITWPDRLPESEWGKEWHDIKNEIKILNYNEKVFLGASIMMALEPDEETKEKDAFAVDERNFYENPYSCSLRLTLSLVPAQKVRLVFRYLHNFMKDYTLLPKYKKR